MNTEDLIRSIANKTGISKRIIRCVIDSTFSTITTALCENDSVQIKRFGTFETIKRNSRKSNLGNGSTIPERKTPAFRASAILKNIIQMDGENYEQDFSKT